MLWNQFSLQLGLSTIELQDSSVNFLSRIGMIHCLTTLWLLTTWFWLQLLLHITSNQSWLKATNLHSFQVIMLHNLQQCMLCSTLFKMIKFHKKTSESSVLVPSTKNPQVFQRIQVSSTGPSDFQVLTLQSKDTPWTTLPTRFLDLTETCSRNSKFKWMLPVLNNYITPVIELKLFYH